MLLLVGCYCVYAEVANRLLFRERQSRQVVVQPPEMQGHPIGPRLSHEAATRYLPDAPWTVDSRVKIRADGLHLFFNDRTHENTNTEVRVSPVAMIWTAETGETSDGNQKDPLVILAEAAVFQFDEPVELSDIRTHLIRQITLRGQVLIRGADGLHVAGSNFTFSRASQNLFSDHPIRFRMQQHRGVARNIQLNLEMLDGGIHSNNPRILGIKEVVTRDHLELQLMTGENQPTLVTCEDRFLFLVKEQHALLRGDVFVHHTEASGNASSLNCDLLRLQFTQETTPPDTAAQADHLSEDLLTSLPTDQPLEAAVTQRARTGIGQLGPRNGLTLQSIHAEAQEGQLVKAEALGHGFEATGQRFDYDLIKRVAVLTHQKAVQIRAQGVDLLTPRLELHLTADLQPQFAHCAGPGQLQYVTEALPPNTPAGTGAVPVRTRIMEANWRDALVLAPDNETNPAQQVITLTGVVRLSSPVHRAGLMAQKVRFWIEQLSPGTEAGTSATHLAPPTRPGQQIAPANLVSGTQSTAAPTSPAAAMAGQICLRKAIASGEVAIASSPLEGKYEAIELNFQNDTQGLFARLNSQPAGNNDIQLTAGQQTSSGANPPGNSLPDTRFQINARQLTLQIIHDAEFKQMHLAHIESQGEIQATGLLPGQAEPLMIAGRGAEILNQGHHHQRFRLLGANQQLAWVQQGQLRIDGIDLFVDRGQNLARVHGSGSLQIPVNNNWEGTQLGEAELLQVSWKEQMKFQGNQAHFAGRVRASIGDSIITCEELFVTLDQPVSLQQASPSAKPQILQVDCRDRVRFEMNHYEDSKLMGVRFVNVASFRINHQTGDMRGQGPGAMEFWQRRTGQSPLGMPEAAMTRGAGKPTAPPAEGWDYTRVTFAGEMTGNMHQQQATLHDRVNVLYGPVERPLVSFERDARPPSSVWMRCESLELLVKKAAPESPTPWSMELQARHNTEIEGDQFLARADVVSYDHQNNLFVMRALENRHATLWYFEHPQAPRSRYDVKMVRLSPNGNILELDRTLGASGSR